MLRCRERAARAADVAEELRLEALDERVPFGAWIVRVRRRCRRLLAQLWELGDVFAWLSSLANQLGLSLEDAAQRYVDDPPI